jgi:hypothetical protein
MPSHIRNQSITKSRHIVAQLTEWTYSNQPLLRTNILGLGRMAPMIHVSWVARDSLRSIYGKTTQFQNTVYLASIKCSQIMGSVCLPQSLNNYVPSGLIRGHSHWFLVT